MGRVALVTNISPEMPFLTCHAAMSTTSLILSCFVAFGMGPVPGSRSGGGHGVMVSTCLWVPCSSRLPYSFFSSCRRAMSAESYSALSCLPQFFFSKNHSFLVAFTSFSAAPAEQKAGALQRPFIFRCEILCAFNYFYK